jgi:2-polyprenyl-3-methyl-5-hydroxy-6-metoxy-1,4-benzoquinol methylase
MSTFVCHVCFESRFKRLGENRDFPGHFILACAACDFISTYPVPAASTLTSFYEGSYSQRNYGRTHNFSRYDERAAAQLRFLRDAGVTDLQENRVIDIGCGPGSFLVAAERMGASVVGFEADSMVANAASKRLSKSGAMITGLFEPHVVDRGAFDLIVISHVLEHVANPLSWMNEVVKILRPGGIVFIEVPNSDARRTRRFIRRDLIQGPAT